MTKDVKFNRLNAYNLTELVDVCLDDSTLYSRRCLDVSHNCNYHLFTNQKSRYIFKSININQSLIIQLSETQLMVPSENSEDKLICTLELSSYLMLASIDITSHIQTTGNPLFVHIQEHFLQVLLLTGRRYSLISCVINNKMNLLVSH